MKRIFEIRQREGGLVSSLKLAFHLQDPEDALYKVMFTVMDMPTGKEALVVEGKNLCAEKVPSAEFDEEWNVYV